MCHLFSVRYVDANGNCPRTRCYEASSGHYGTIGVDIQHPDGGTFASERCADHWADAAGRAGDHDEFAVQSEIHRSTVRRPVQSAATLVVNVLLASPLEAE